MGIESDQLVYDYLSRVGDLAQQQQLSSAERMRLVSGLRETIDRQRSSASDTPGAVKRILGKLGTPEEVVRKAGGGVADDGQEPARPVHRPVEAEEPPSGPQGPPSPRERLGLLRRLGGLAGKVPGPRSPDRPVKEKGGPPEGREADGADPLYVPTVPLDGPAPPHLAGEDEVGSGAADVDWWRVEPGPFGGTEGARFGPGEAVPGFVGGIEIPEMLRPPPQDPFAKASKGAKEPERSAEAEEGEWAEPGRAGGGLLGRVLRGSGSMSPLLLLAAALLVSGAIVGSLVVLGAGWLIAYATRRLSRAEAKWAVLGLPGLVAAGALVWVWGRFDGRWGEAVPKGGMADVLVDTWPVALRTAAVASALFLVWRARRLRA
ncbi:hypothetical protein [Streptomyces sp. TP-A0874]|uniref:hypothetical protein n=1 Tax=Streptomyces sp. TP-A0874 TaxID=549819 RepID=UPI000852CB93|nr:hypothetical protein [Streptomyces sp. TP-A0874]